MCKLVCQLKFSLLLQDIQLLSSWNSSPGMAPLSNGAVRMWPQVWLPPKALASPFTLIVFATACYTCFCTYLLKPLPDALSWGPPPRARTLSRFQTLTSVTPTKHLPPQVGMAARKPETPLHPDLQWKDLFSHLQTHISPLCSTTGFSLYKGCRPYP